MALPSLPTAPYRVIAPDLSARGQSDVPDRATFAYAFERSADLVNGRPGEAEDPGP
jgi:hypothetical protein